MKFRFCGDLDCPDWILAEIAILSKLTSVRIKVLTTQIIAYSVAGNFDYNKILKLASDNEDGINEIKGAIAATHFIITNACKHDVDELSLIQEIQQLGLPKENSEALGKQYREYKDKLHEALFNQSYRINKLISTDWRIDHIVASSLSVKNDQDPLSVNLRIKYDNSPLDVDNYNNDKIKEISFEMSTDKLDLLIYELSNVSQYLDSLQS